MQLNRSNIRTIILVLCIIASLTITTANPTTNTANTNTNNEKSTVNTATTNSNTNLNTILSYLDFQLPKLPPGAYFNGFIYFSIIVYLFELYLSYRQYCNYYITIKPIELSWITIEEFNKAQLYGRDKSKFSILVQTFNLLKLLLLLHYQFYPQLYSISIYISQYLFNTDITNQIYHSIIFFILDSLFDTVLSIPFSYYSIFYIEQSHGFNKQTVRLFITDTVKSILLQFVIGIPLLSLFIYIITIGGEYFYIYVWFTLFCVQILAVILYPTLIQPCFNKVQRLPNGELRTAIELLAASQSFPLTELYEIDGSKRSAHSNAYMYGFFKSKRIVIYDTLISQSSIPQVVAVLAHEIGHNKKNHTIKNLILAQIQTFILFFLFGKSMNNRELFNDFGFNSIHSVYIGLILFQFLYSPIQHIISYLMNILSRKFEFEADAYAGKLGYSSDLIAGLIILQKENKGTMIPDSYYSAYHHSHPPVLERIRELEKFKSYQKKTK